MKPPFRIKICGITQNADAEFVSRSGADAIGLNFYAKSSRAVDGQVGATIETGPAIKRVGVFVNHPTADIIELVKRCRLDYVQLHGDETPSSVRPLVNLPLIPVVRIRPEMTPDSIHAQIDAWVGSDFEVGAVLIDAQIGAAYGGTGHTLDWEFAAKLVKSVSVPVVLAGGLKPDNVRQAIQKVGPAGVDVASGVELSPGVKSEAAVNRFVREAESGWTSTDASA